MLYEKPQLEIIMIPKQDVIRTSPMDIEQGGPTGGNDEDFSQ